MRKLITLQLLLLLFTTDVDAYEETVHEKITEHAISASNIGQYINSNLNISLDTKFAGQSVDEWLKMGSKKEDESPRWVNHFYDPTNGSGLTELTIGLPSLRWAKDAPTNVYSWQWARDAYYKALTDANAKFREEYFAMVFSDMGQVMHLAQDLAHARVGHDVLDGGC